MNYNSVCYSQGSELKISKHVLAFKIIVCLAMLVIFEILGNWMKVEIGQNLWQWKDGLCDDQWLPQYIWLRT